MLVFSTNSPYDYWDGRNKKGEVCPEGVYVCKISYWDINKLDNPDYEGDVMIKSVTLVK